MTPATQDIPEHLRHFIAEQDPNSYTAIDHACWRYIMRVSKAFFKDHAHEKYLTGLEQTGISTDRIPLISEMDEKLRRFGWRAVAVTGFIPPAAFMEFQSLGILPIACDMRKLEHLAYTPAPDIVHEAAGHAPILADAEYAQYLRAYGQVARRAIFSKNDMDVYEAILNLSETKEDPDATVEQISKAQRQLEQAITNQTYVSEATYLARMNWWTVEYGLVGPIDNPLIYGAGLLSSAGESHGCLGQDVKKLPFTLDCLNQAYDITRPQPQLFVTPHFQRLLEVLHQYQATMAFTKGGVEGLTKAMAAQSVCTLELDSGLQISGVVDHFINDAKGDPCFFKLSGPSQLAYQDAELPGHSTQYHKDGFSSPIGRVNGIGQSLSDLSPTDLGTKGLELGKPCRLKFESGVVLDGILKSIIERNGKIKVLSFDKCTVVYGDRKLFLPEWGTYDLACGLAVSSVFGGAADRGNYLKSLSEKPKRPRPQKNNLTEESKNLAPLYQKVRNLRDSATVTKTADSQFLTRELSLVLDELDKRFASDWLLRLEMVEMDQTFSLAAEWRVRLERQLREISKDSNLTAELITRGLKVITT